MSVGWAPYRHGRWGYTHYGYTWISYEPWGWAPYHYGRWGYNHHGWHWVPGRHWGPAWVSFAIGPTWVGWSPLGYHAGSVFSYASLHHGHNYYGYRGRYRGGKAVPRHVYDNGAGWNFSRAREFGSRAGHARLRVDQVRSTSSAAALHRSASVLDRSLTPHALDARGKARGTLQRPRGCNPPGGANAKRTSTDRFARGKLAAGAGARRPSEHEGDPAQQQYWEYRDYRARRSSKIEHGPLGRDIDPQAVELDPEGHD